MMNRYSCERHNAKGLQVLLAHPVGNDVRKARNHELTRADDAARAADSRIARKHGFGRVKHFEYDPRCGGGAVLPDVVADGLEVALSELCPAQPQASSPTSRSAARGR